MCVTLIKPSVCVCVFPRSGATHGTDGKLVQAQDPLLQAHNGFKQATAAATAAAATDSAAAAESAAADYAATNATAAGYSRGCARSP